MHCREARQVLDRLATHLHEFATLSSAPATGATHTPAGNLARDVDRLRSTLVGVTPQHLLNAA